MRTVTYRGILCVISLVMILSTGCSSSGGSDANTPGYKTYTTADSDLVLRYPIHCRYRKMRSPQYITMPTWCPIAMLQTGIPLILLWPMPAFITTWLFIS